MLAQFLVLLYKNFKLKGILVLLCELIAPILIVMMLVGGWYGARSSSSALDYSLVPFADPYSVVGPSHQLIYAPSGSDSDSVLNLLFSSSPDSIRGFANETDMIQFYEDNKGHNICCAVVFSSSDFSANNSIDFTMRFPQRTVPDSSSHSKVNPLDSKAPSYANSGFAGLQSIISQAITSYLTNTTQTTFYWSSTTPHGPEYATVVKKWARSMLYGYAGGPWITIALIPIFFNFVSNIVKEKQFKLREGMKMMGMRDSMYWLSWMLSSLITYFIPLITIVGILFRIGIFSSHCSFGLVFLFYFLYVISIITMGMLASTFFDNSKYAGLISSFVVVALAGLGPIVTQVFEIERQYQMLLCLFPPTAFHIGNSVGVQFENKDTGINYSNAREEFGLPSFASVIGMLMLDIFAYSFLAWYVNNVRSGEYGVSKPFYFLFTRDYWCPRLGQPSMEGIELEEDGSVVTEVMNRTSPVAVDIRKLRREFKTKHGTQVAVDSVSLKLYEGEIFCLLGHNGAGKSTTISILCGLIPATSGDAIVAGKSIHTQLDEVRKSVGVCPQYNNLWDDLSVVDHLIVYAGIKGVSVQDIPAVVKSAMQDVQLSEKKFQVSSTLSGGQKRRLCMAIAMIGNSKVVFLDEPTSGLDPQSRRAIWSYINKNKKNRLIVLTTHFLDEADYLGDRVGIMSAGKLKCVGSPLFLKSRFGDNFTLTFVKSDQTKDTGALQDFVKTAIPDSQELSSAGREISYQLPHKDLQSYSELFTELEKHGENLSVDSFGISTCSLEDVFMKLAKEDVTQTSTEQVDIEKAVKQPTQLDRHSFTQLRALLWKRWLASKRDIRMLLLQILVPILCVALAVGINEGLHLPSPDGNSAKFQFNLQSLYSFVSPTTPYSGTNLPPLYEDTSFNLEYEGTQDDLIDYWKKAENLGGGYIFPIAMSTTYEVGLAYNNTLTHVIPVYVNLLLSSVLQNATGKVLEVYSQPLKNYNPIFDPNVNKQLIFLLVILVGVSVFASSVPVYTVNEKSGKAKQLQIINGTYPVIYWLSNFIWEYLLSLPVIVFFIVVLLIGDVGRYSQYIGDIFVILSLYFISAIGMAYSLSFSLKSPFAAQGLVLFSQLAPSIGFVIAFLATFAALSTNIGLSAITTMGQVFCALCPSFGVMWSFMIFTDFLSLRTTWGSSGIWNMNQLGIPAVWLTAHAVFWILLVLFLEYYPRWKGKWKRNSTDYSKTNNVAMNDIEDQDVRRERSRVTDPNYNKDSIAIIHLRKQWNKDSVALQDLCLGIPNGECFGLLGVNGAGKSTTISILSGEISPTSGEAFLNGYNITTQLSQVQQSIGVCPQHDALLDHLTGREHLRLYGLLKGIAPQNVDGVVVQLLDLLKIQLHADKMVQNYSGGTKRKLSLAIALIGNPSILFLDEPSTGMDPVSRHFMWRLIMEISKEKSIILTTHSMQECDAVCSNIGIMNQGRLKCLGSSQHLKHTYGNGYNLHLKLTSPDMVDPVVAFFTDNYKGAKVLEIQERVVKLEIPSQNLSLSKLFKDLDQQQEELGFEDYAVTQTTLEQIFLNMSAPKTDMSGK